MHYDYFCTSSPLSLGVAKLKIKGLKYRGMKRTMALINLRKISLGFGSPRLLEAIDLQIEKGERVCLVGRNGAGKSTLMRLISGEVLPDGGEISFAPGLKAAVLSQEIPKDLKGTVFDVITGGLGDVHGLMNEYHAAVAALEAGGEKALAGASVFGKVAYFTTYTPAEATGVCSADSSGNSRLYALDYLTAAAAYNYNPYNDPAPGPGVDDDDAVKDRTDRSTDIGSGIASGIVTSVGPDGFSALIGSGGAIVKPEVKQSGSSIPRYWREVH